MEKTGQRPGDLFEELCSRAQCSFISDMDSHRGVTDAVQRARRAMAELELSDYPAWEVQDAAHFLYGEVTAFDDASQAKMYFRKKLGESEKSNN